MSAQLESIFRLVLEASWQGSIVVLLILALRPLMGTRVPVRWRTWLWLLVIVRLLIPASLMPPSLVSIQNVALVDQPLEQVQIIESSTLSVSPADAARTTPSQASGSIESTSTTPAPVHIPWLTIIASIWFTGTVIALVTIGIAQVVVRRQLGKLSEPSDPFVREAWEKCCARLGLKHRPALRTSAAIASPALLGLFQPMLLLPENTPGFTLADWENVFIHELAHYRRGDAWTQALQLVTLAVHWFNPVVWIGFRRMRADRELAADEWALQHLGAESSTAYGGTLLKVLERSSRSALPMTAVGILEDRVQMQQRLQRIVGFSRTSMIGSLAGFAIVVAVALLVLGRSTEKTDLSNYPGYAPIDLLVKSAARGDLPIVRKALSDGADINGGAGYSPISMAAGSDRQEVVRFLISKGADVNRRNPGALTPLEEAMVNGHAATAEILTAAGAKSTPLQMAAFRGDMPALQTELAKQPLNFDEASIADRIAAGNGHPEAFRAILHAIRALPGKSQWQLKAGDVVTLIAHGQRESLLAVIDEKPSWDPHGNHGGVVRIGRAVDQTPGMRDWMIQQGISVPDYNDGERLIDAALDQDIKEMDRLLKKGTPVEYLGECSWTPITLASIWNCVHSVKFLLEHGADPNSHHYSYTGIEMTSMPAIADLLYKAGAKLEPGSVNYNLSFGPPEMIKWFLDHGVDAKKPLESGNTLLSSARTPENAELLISQGADVKAADKYGRTALQEICMMAPKPAEIARVLLKHGADPNARDNHGHTPIMGARDGATVDVLVEYGADPKATLPDGTPMIRMMSHMADSTWLDAMIRHGVPFDLKTDGPTLMMSAAWSGHADIIKVLLDKGVDPNAKGEWSKQHNAYMRPLEAAVVEGSLPAVKTLLDGGATITDQDMMNAIGNRRDPVVELLWEHGARNVPEVTYRITQNAPAAGIQKLLDGGADPGFDNKISGSLNAAAQRGQLDTVKVLADHGAKPANLAAALYAASWTAQSDVVAWLLQKGVPPDMNALTAAATNSNPYPKDATREQAEKTMRLLIDAGGLKQLGPEEKSEVLLCAVYTRAGDANLNVLKMLVDAGADVDAKGRNGKSIRESVAEAPNAGGYAQKEVQDFLASIPQKK